MGIADFADTFEHIIHQQVFDGLSKQRFRTGLDDGVDLCKKVFGIVERKNGLERTVGEWPLAIDTCSPLTQRLLAIEIYFCLPLCCTLFIALLILVGPQHPKQFDIRIGAIFLSCQRAIEANRDHLRMKTLLHPFSNLVGDASCLPMQQTSHCQPSESLH